MEIVPAPSTAEPAGSAATRKRKDTNLCVRRKPRQPTAIEDIDEADAVLPLESA